MDQPKAVPTRAAFREVIARAIATGAGVDELATVAHELALKRHRDERNARKRASRAAMRRAGRSERRRAAA